MRSWARHPVSSLLHSRGPALPLAKRIRPSFIWYPLPLWPLFRLLPPLFQPVSSPAVTDFYPTSTSHRRTISRSPPLPVDSLDGSSFSASYRTTELFPDNVVLATRMPQLAPPDHLLSCTAPRPRSGHGLVSSDLNKKHQFMRLSGVVPSLQSIVVYGSRCVRSDSGLAVKMAFY